MPFAAKEEAEMNRIVAVAFATAAQFVLLPTPAAASAPVTSQGVNITESFTATDCRFADGNCFFSGVGRGTATGSVSGTWNETVNFIVFKDNSAVFSGTHVCTCTYLGRTGVITYVFEGKSPPDFSFFGRAVIVSATGGLAGLHGFELFSSDGTTPVTQVTYVLHFDP